MHTSDVAALMPTHPAPIDIKTQLYPLRDSFVTLA